MGEIKECRAGASARDRDDYIFDWDFQIPPPQPYCVDKIDANAKNAVWMGFELNGSTF